MAKEEKRSPSASPNQQPEMVLQKSAPMQMTQEEVAAMAAGGAEAQVVVERLSFSSTKTAPQPVSKAEIMSIQQSGNIPKALQARIEQASIDHVADEQAEKQLPTKAPPQ